MKGTTNVKDNAELNARIEANLPLVKHVVFQVAVHFPRHVDREELARAGALGLVEAARRYDDSRGVPFERFAAQRIRGAILDSVRAADWAPRSVRLLARRLEATEQQLATQLGRVPNNDEMAKSLGVTKQELTKLQDRLFRSVVLALDHETSDDTDEDLTLVDILKDRSTVEPSEELETRELHNYLRDAVGLLPERQRFVIVGYFLEGRTSQDLARFLGVTESRISQLRSEALRNLKLGIEAQYTDAETDAPVGRVAKRQAAYADSVSDASDWKTRLSRWDTQYDVPEEPLLPVAGGTTSRRRVENRELDLTRQ
ncbi:MAG: FliA/WhiG family RNA polymerase sigma factor [Actinomycetota bacterium]